MREPRWCYSLTEEGDNAEVFPSVNATAVEFDSYSRSQGLRRWS